jgi:hypothetical protein
VELTGHSLLMVPVALSGAVFLSFGVQMQSRGVERVGQRLGRQVKALSTAQVRALASSGSWLLGTLMLGLAVLLQLVSITFAPLIMVQPLGAVALVVTTWSSSRATGVRFGKSARRAVWFCVSGIACFVGIAAFVSEEGAVARAQLVQILVTLAVVFAVIVLASRFGATRRSALFYVVGAGVLYGFVATLAKLILDRFVHGTFDGLSVVAVIGVLVAVGTGALFVQSAYACGSVDLVVAGLTVIDPIVAVGIGVLVLDEAVGAPPVAIGGFLAAAGVAVAGVFLLAKRSP